MIRSARHAAYLALNQSLQSDLFLSDILEPWRQSGHLDPRDFHLLEELVYGTMRHLYTLDAYAVQLSHNQKLSLKLKEKNLVRLALYQYLYLDKIPLYAIGQEMVELAKKETHPRFVAFLSALIRRFEQTEFKEPTALWQKVSAPSFLIDEFLKQYTAQEIQGFFEVFNTAPKLMMRHRIGGIGHFVPFDAQWLKDPLYYVQNKTPANLIDFLAKGAPGFNRILDLCAAPGGKLLLAHDLYPKADLFANDPSPLRLETLKMNLAKYGVAAKLLCEKGESVTSDEPFDLIILDVPCSNTGVLHKRAEARYRIDAKNLAQLAEIQYALLQNAFSLLSPHGEIWYMTCSILRTENEEMVHRFCRDNNLTCRKSHLQLPDREGADGGYGAAIRRPHVNQRQH